MHFNSKNNNYIKKIDADINKKIKNCRLYMAGIKQRITDCI